MLVGVGVSDPRGCCGLGMLLLFLLYISFLNWLTIAEAGLPLLDVGLVLRLGSLACVLRWRRTLAFGRMEGR